MNEETKNLIKSEIDNNDVCLFMKGTPDAPQCGFSMAVCNMLKILEESSSENFYNNKGQQLSHSGEWITL